MLKTQSVEFRLELQGIGERMLMLSKSETGIETLIRGCNDNYDNFTDAKELQTGATRGQFAYDLWVILYMIWGNDPAVYPKKLSDYIAIGITLKDDQAKRYEFEFSEISQIISAIDELLA